jgi:hypothetical protein
MHEVGVILGTLRMGMLWGKLDMRVAELFSHDVRMNYLREV